MPLDLTLLERYKDLDHYYLEDLPHGQMKKFQKRIRNADNKSSIEVMLDVIEET